MNESIKSFNEGEAEMKEGEQKMERGGGGAGVPVEGRREWICVPKVKAGF